MPSMTVLIDNTIPVAEDFNGNFRRLNQALGTGSAITNYAQGDTLYASTTDTLARRAIGNEGDVYSVVGGVPRWSASGAVAGTWQQRKLQGVLTTSALTVSADSVMLRNSGLGIKVFEGTGDITCDSAAQGLNGRDQAAVFAANQVLHAYWISNGSLLRTVLADSAPVTGPDLTTLAAFSGYTYWGYIAPLVWDASSLFFPARIRGSWVAYETLRSALASGVATSETSINIAPHVPPCLSVRYLLSMNAVGGSAGTDFASLRPIAGAMSSKIANNSAASGAKNSLVMDLPYVTATPVYIVFAAGAVPELSVDIAGYQVGNGGE